MEKDLMIYKNYQVNRWHKS